MDMANEHMQKKELMVLCGYFIIADLGPKKTVTVECIDASYKVHKQANLT